jgi:hypothetical protein
MAFVTEENYRKTKEYAYERWLVENEEFLKRFLESRYDLKPVGNKLPKIDINDIWQSKDINDNLQSR